MNNLGFNFIANTGDSVKRLTKLGKSVDTTSSSLKKSQTQIKKINNSFGNMTKDANRASKSISNLGNAFRGMSTIFGGYAVGNAMRNSISSAMDMIETINLFSVSMGDLAVNTDKTVRSISKMTGLDVTNIQNAMGTYSLLSRSMGMTNQQAQILSTSTYRLGLDLASLTNVPVQQVMQDLRSGLVGQSETVYKYGVDVTEASLKTEALRLGIEKSVRNMSQGEKMALRYSVMIRQTSLAQGDFARTIEQPANQLRILTERMTTLSRSIGTMFIPMLSRILPYANAVVIALTRIIDRLAILFGYEGDKVWDTFGNIGSGAEDISDGLDDATGSAKKLKGQLMGFDEINLWKEPESGSGVGGAGAITGDFSDWELGTFDSQFDTIKQKAEGLADGIEDALKRIFDIAIIIGGVIAGWKLAWFLMDLATSGSLLSGLSGKVIDLSKKIGLLNAQGGLGALVPHFATIVIMVTRFTDLINKSEMFRDGLKEIGDWFVKLGDGLKKLGSYFLDQLIPESAREDVRKFFGMFEGLIDVLDLDFADLLITLGGIALLFTPLAPFGVALLAFEAITLAIRGIGYASEDVIDDFDLFAEGISNSTKEKLEPLLGLFDEIDIAITGFAFGEKVIDENDVESVKSKLSEIKEMMINELDADRNESLKNLEPLRDALGEDAFNELLDSTNQYYIDVKAKIADNEQAILDIMQQAKDDGVALSDEQHKEINRLMEENQAIGIKHMVENADELELIYTRMKDNTVRIELERGQEILKNARQAKDDIIRNADDQYSRLILEADRMLEIGAITEEQHQLMIDSAENMRNETVSKAEQQYQSIYDKTTEGMGEIVKYLDLETLEMKSKWQMFADDMRDRWVNAWNEMVDGFTTWKENVTTKVQELWDGVKTTIKNNASAIKDEFANVFKGAINHVIGMFNRFIGNVNSMLNFSWEGISIAGKEIIPSGSITLGRLPTIPMLAGGGIVDYGQMFIAREAGAELVGGFGSKTGVMNNEQIVEAVADGVYRAVTSAMQVTQAGSGSGGRDVILQIDGREIARGLLPEINTESQRLGYRPILNYNR